MRTTIDLPDRLFYRAKQVALDRKQTLKSLIINAIQRELNADQPALRRMSSPPVPLGITPFAPALSNADVAELMEEADIAKSGQ